MTAGVALPVGRAVHRRNGLRRKGTRPARQVIRLPLRHSHRRRSQPARGTGIGEYQRRGQRHPAALVVEVVGVLIVADQHRVHRPERVGAHHGAGQFGQVAMLAGRIEGRVHH
ncbi:hypothetical protein AWC11_22345 [Mycobacterium interjectum]|nr:hypothetical protein AWC11_22345 [Mycobacterium interjectum]